MSNMRSLTHFTCFAAAAALAFGCADPEGNFSDFKDRHGKINGGGGAGGADAGTQDAGACVVPMAGELDGDYMFALSAVTAGNKANKNRPIMVFTTVTTKDGAGGLEMDWNLQPVEWKDRKTPAGSAISINGIAVDANGSFDVDPDPLDVVGIANPLSGSDITADITSLKGDGTICNTGGFYCGTVAGDVSKPIPLSIAGSTWTLEKIEGGVYPEPPKIDCAKNEALPLPIQPL